MLFFFFFVFILYFGFFFFFKQKTAYEMRISDWSSDVCSSDLPARDRVPRGHSCPARRHRSASPPSGGNWLARHRSSFPSPSRPREGRTVTGRRRRPYRPSRPSGRRAGPCPTASCERTTLRPRGDRKSVVEGRGVAVSVDS